MSEMMTGPEVAKHLRVSEKTVKRYRERKKNPLPATKPGRSYLYDRADVEKFKEQCRVIK